MKIRFSPKPKTLKKAELIYNLREKGVIWDKVAIALGHTVRYCQALNEYYVDNIKEVSK